MPGMLSAVAKLATGDTKGAGKAALNATGVPAAISTVKKAASGDAEAIGSVAAIVTIGVVAKKMSPTPAATGAASTDMSALNGSVRTAASELSASGKAPATIVGAELNGQTAIATSGAPPAVIAPQLEAAVGEMGGIGTKTASGNTVGCCAEFQAGNKLLLDNPSATPQQINFTDAIRPRTGQVVPPCENCKTTFGE